MEQTDRRLLAPHHSLSVFPDHGLMSIWVFMLSFLGMIGLSLAAAAAMHTFRLYN